MAEFLTTKGVASKIEDIIKYAEDELILISPYYKISNTFLDRLWEAVNREVDILIVHGKVQLSNNDFYALKDLPSIKLLYYEDLHAKCYLNEQSLVITSMNMHQFSERNNREMGVFVQKNIDDDFYRKAKQEVVSIIDGSELILSNVQSNNDSAFCIRCGCSIPFNTNAPYCSNCYSTWADFRNPNYQENLCHSCGNGESTMLNKPLCYNCYS